MRGPFKLGGACRIIPAHCTFLVLAHSWFAWAPLAGDECKSHNFIDGTHGTPQRLTSLTGSDSRATPIERTPHAHCCTCERMMLRHPSLQAATEFSDRLHLHTGSDSRVGCAAELENCPVTPDDLAKLKKEEL